MGVDGGWPSVLGRVNASGGLGGSAGLSEAGVGAKGSVCGLEVGDFGHGNAAWLVLGLGGVRVGGISMTGAGSGGALMSGGGFSASNFGAGVLSTCVWRIGTRKSMKGGIGPSSGLRSGAGCT